MFYFLANSIISWGSVLGSAFCRKEAVVEKMWVPGLFRLRYLLLVKCVLKRCWRFAEQTAKANRLWGIGVGSGDREKVSCLYGCQ